MADIVSKKKRSEMMAGIGSKDTKPEKIVRSNLHRRGLRYGLNTKYLPCKPDLYLRKYKVAVLVHGCFWHAHGCHLFRVPKTRPESWAKKFETNKRRDRRNIVDLNAEGVRVCIVWECALKNKRLDSLNELMDSVASWIKSDDSEYVEFL